MYDKSHLGMPMSFTINPDQSRIICGFESGDVLFWNVLNVQFEKKESLSSKPILHLVSISNSEADSDSLLVLDSTGRLRLSRDSDSSSSGFKSADYGENTTSMTARKDGKLLLLGMSTGKGRLISTKSLKTLSLFPAHSDRISNSKWNQLSFFTFGQDHRVCCYKPYNH